MHGGAGGKGQGSGGNGCNDGSRVAWSWLSLGEGKVVLGKGCNICGSGEEKMMG